jgi:hypothetical protein
MLLRSSLLYDIQVLQETCGTRFQGNHQLRSQEQSFLGNPINPEHLESSLTNRLPHRNMISPRQSHQSRRLVSARLRWNLEPQLSLLSQKPHQRDLGASRRLQPCRPCLLIRGPRSPGPTRGTTYPRLSGTSTPSSRSTAGRGVRA